MSWREDGKEVGIERGAARATYDTSAEQGRAEVQIARRAGVFGQPRCDIFNRVQKRQTLLPLPIRGVQRPFRNS